MAFVIFLICADKVGKAFCFCKGKKPLKKPGFNQVCNSVSDLPMSIYQKISWYILSVTSCLRPFAAVPAPPFLFPAPAGIIPSVFVFLLPFVLPPGASGKGLPGKGCPL